MPVSAPSGTERQSASRVCFLGISARRLRSVIQASLLVACGVLTLYIGANVLGLIRNSSEHYTNFALGIAFITGLIAIRDAIDQGLGGMPRSAYLPRLLVAVAGTLIATTGAAYLRLNANRLAQILPFYEPRDVAMGLVFTVGILLLTWIHWGPLLTAIISAAILYFFFGHHLSNPLITHPQYDAAFVMNYVALATDQGFFWLVQEAADSIYFLILYAAILLGVGTLKMMLEVGKASGRYVKGGAAFPALVGSGMVASVMGTAVSNVVLTGRFTIPMMKKHGFTPAMAGSVEAVASTAGQIMPPILGLAAFIMAGFLNIPYIEVALAALIPALLFMSGCFIGVLVYAQRYDLPRLAERVNWPLIWRVAPAFIFSFVLVLVLLLYYFSPSLSGLVGIGAALVLCLFQGRFRPTLKDLYRSLEDGLVLVALLSLLLIAIGPLGQVMITTNLAARLGMVVIHYLPESTLILLMGTMVVSLFLGMGLPTPVAYVIVAIALVPFLQQLGVTGIEAHLFAFYFAVFSALTPPVAVGVLAAAKLAQASFLATALDSMKLALNLLIIPFAFVYYPALLKFPHLGWDVVVPIATVLYLQWTVSVACYGHFLRTLNAVERAGFTLVSCLGFAGVVTHGNTVNAVFVGTAFALMGWIWTSRYRAAVARRAT